MGMNYETTCLPWAKPSEPCHYATCKRACSAIFALTYEPIPSSHISPKKIKDCFSYGKQNTKTYTQSFMFATLLGAIFPIPG